jgi:hypothetical protein
MMQHIGVSDDAELCKQVLATIALVYRPITLAELMVLTELFDDIADEAEVEEVIGLCGSFLALREDTVYFVHQSAQDFLLEKASDEVFPHGIEAAHHVIFSRSLAILSKTLHRDVYSLEAPGVSVDNMKPPTPDPLAASRYPCIYWIDHLCDSKPKSRINDVDYVQVMGLVGQFVRKKYLYWLEGLSLCKGIAKGVVSMARLCSLNQVRLAQALRLSVVLGVDGNTVMTYRVTMSLLSSSKMPADSSCTTKGQLRATLSSHTHLRCCSVRPEARLENCSSTKSQKGLLSSQR